jgi:acyl-CoA reductase-like NAD-dependent aldehyde dehydrogenase
MKRLLLECGGKAPAIVFEDCGDVGALAKSLAAKAFWNQGQVCTASSRLLLQKSIKPAVLDALLHAIADVVPGDPLDPATRFGALVSAAHRDKVMNYVADGIREGATLISRASNARPNSSGYFVGPVVFDKVDPDHRIAQEEIFGPVLSVLEFNDEEEALRLANSTIYGLSARVWTRDASRAHRMANGIEAGWTVIESSDDPGGEPAVGSVPTGGHRQSGFGVEGGLDGLAAYCRSTTVQHFL